MRDSRRAAALIVVVLLVTVLSTFTLAAVSQLVATVASGRDSTAEARATWLAELGRADAFAYVNQHPDGPWPYSRPLTTVSDDRGSASGQYAYTITDRTLPEMNQRRFVQIHAYWPTQGQPVASRRLQVWLEKGQDNWSVTAWALGEYANE